MRLFSAIVITIDFCHRKLMLNPAMEINTTIIGTQK